MIQTGRMASSSYVKLFFPCSESGSNVDPVDVILGATYPPAQANTGNGLMINQGTEAGAITISAGSFPTISASQSFILFFVMDGGSGLEQVAYGDTSSGQRIFWNYFISSLSEVSVVTSSGQVQLTGVTAPDISNIHGYAIARDASARTIKHLIDGVQNGNTGTDLGGTLNPPINEMMLNGGDFYGVALFVFDGPLPSDYQEALAWMSPRWAIGQKVIWPAWETK